MDRIEARLDRIDVKIVTKREMHFWGMVLTLELIVGVLMLIWWR